MRVARSTGHLSRRGLLPNLATSQRKKEKIFKNIGTCSLSYGDFNFFILGEKKIENILGGKQNLKTFMIAIILSIVIYIYIYIYAMAVLPGKSP